jgi:uncharacterized protein (TIGR03118 family)
MRVIRVLPFGLLVTVGMGVGCGDEIAGPTETSAALTMPKLSPFESVVREKDEVSDQAGVARHRDRDLVNAWGLALDPRTGLAWIAANGTGTARVFDEDGVFQKAVDLGPDGTDPTGVAFNPTKAFDGDDFIFATESGTLIGVKRGDTKGTTRATATDGAIYKGIALAFVHGKPRLFVTDFHNGKIDVYDGDYELVATKGGFVDRGLPAGFGPFNVLAAGDDLIVSYARQDDDREDDVPGNGNGFLDVFDTDGAFDQRLLSGDAHRELSSPWGMALSRERDERKSVDLLVGNFGDFDIDHVDVSGHINVYELTAGGKRAGATFEGPLGVVEDKVTRALAIPGLWSVVPGNGKGGFDRDDIYFTAGPGENGESEQHGLFGELDFVTARR